MEVVDGNRSQDAGVPLSFEFVSGVFRIMFGFHLFSVLHGSIFLKIQFSFIFIAPCALQRQKPRDLNPQLSKLAKI